MCIKHQKPAVGSTCGIDYCIECSVEYQESLKEPNPKNTTLGTPISWIHVHGKVVWKIGEENG